MSRDSNGNYTLPIGNPVISGTPIDTNWANPTMDDIGAELTNSLSRRGKGGMQVPLKHVNGSVTAPAITFTEEQKTGFYRAAEGDLRVSVNEEDRMRWTSGFAEVWDEDDNVWYPVITVKEASNPSMLINGNFDSWPYGENITATNGYFCDQWICTFVQEGVAHRPFNATKTIDYGFAYKGTHAKVSNTENTPTRVTFYQRLESANTRGTYEKTVTVSFYYSHGALANPSTLTCSLRSANGVDDFSTVSQIATVNLNTNTQAATDMLLYTAQFVIDNPGSVNGFELEISLIPNTGVLFNTTTDIRLGGAKIEEGANRTLFIADDPAINLVKCQRYYNRLGTWFYGQGYRYCEAGFTNLDGGTYCFPVEMRVAPVANLVGLTYESCSFSSTLIDNKSLSIRVNKDGSNGAYRAYGGYVEIDARL